MDTPNSTRPVRIHRTLGTSLLYIGLAAFLTLSLSGLLHWRANAAVTTVDKAPLPVATALYQSQDSYLREVSYLGIVEAGRKADLGFEMAGKLARVSAREGQIVDAGDVLAELDDTQLLAQRKGTLASLEQVRSELQLAELKADRQRDLSGTGAVSKEAWDETRLRAQALSAQVDSVSAKLEELDVAIEKSRLRAPYAGTVAARYLDDGAVVNPGSPVMRLVETTRLEAHIGVPVEKTTALVEGEHYTLSIRSTQAEARLASLRPDIDPLTRTRTAVFELPTDVQAFDGESLTLLLEQSVATRGAWLPLEALQEGQRGAWTVLRVGTSDDGQYTVREAVEVLDTRGDMAFVRGTLTEGDLVIRNGIHRITPGVAVQRQEN